MKIAQNTKVMIAQDSKASMVCIAGMPYGQPILGCYKMLRMQLRRLRIYHIINQYCDRLLFFGNIKTKIAMINVLKPIYFANI